MKRIQRVLIASLLHSAMVLAGVFGLTADASVDLSIQDLLKKNDVPGLALAVIQEGRVTRTATYGFREVETKTPLDADTVMYGASLTKFVFSAFVMQLAHEGHIDIDTSIANLLPRPLPEYGRYSDLAGDERWRLLTLRLLLSHQSGFPNFRFFPPGGGYHPDAKLEFMFDPGARFGYSGEGYYIAQLVVEEALGLKTEAELKKRFFDPLGMNRTSMTWKESFRPNFAQGYTVGGVNEGHNMQSNARAAGSMDTSVNDLSRWVAAFMAGNLIAPEARDALYSPGIAIKSKAQFPPWDPAENPRNADVSLAAGVGVKTFRGPQGRGFFQGGHNDKTDNILVCLIDKKQCVLLLMNTAKGHQVFPQIVELLMGRTGLPWAWSYSSLAE